MKSQVSSSLALRRPSSALATVRVMVRTVNENMTRIAAFWSGLICTLRDGAIGNNNAGREISDSGEDRSKQSNDLLRKSVAKSHPT